MKRRVKSEKREVKVQGLKFLVLSFSFSFFALHFALSSFAQVQVSAQIPGISAIDEKYTWDFGKAKEGDILTHTYQLKNDTEKVMNITGVNTTCGCTTSQVKKTMLNPGESTDIEVKFDTKGYSGVIQRYIYVNTDSLDNPVIRLIIKADILKIKR